jgi:phage protein D
MTVVETHVAAVEVEIEGTPFDPEGENTIEVAYTDNLMLPDEAVLRVADPDLRFMGEGTLDIGKKMTVAFCSPGSRRVTKVFTGQITTLEPEFVENAVILTVRAYDESHKLNRTKKTRTFQKMGFAAIVQKVAKEAGFSASVSASGGTQEFVQQRNETDWEFLQRLASMVDAEIIVSDKKLLCRPAGGETAGPPKVRLTWGRTPIPADDRDRPMLLSFRPRVTGIQQVESVVVRFWDPAAKRVVDVKSKVVQPASKIGITRDQVKSKLGGGEIVVPDAPVSTQADARKLGGSLAAYLAHAFLEAEGECEGDPRIRCGTKVEIKGLGSRFSGEYVVSTTTHVYRAGGYWTKFRVTGRAPRTLLDVMSPARRRKWSDNLVVGIVTQNDDKEGLGRVRVKYPGLDEGVEGWWARIATGGAAGRERGMLMTPMVGDEVLIGFEAGDVNRPYVLGTLYNGKAKPGPMATKDGSFWLKSDKFTNVTSKDSITIKGEKDWVVEIAGQATEKVSKSQTVSVSQKLSLDAGDELTLKCGQAKITLKKDGSVEVSGLNVKIAGNAKVDISGNANVTIKGGMVQIN